MEAKQKNSTPRKQFRKHKKQADRKNKIYATNILRKIKEDS